ncbi:FMN-dependent dehydrogenase-domain-containing protein [Biscogniauxia marginata]|nr:FMN-dependent dehydrogenase-domain-containing protein [Biscogniauxia marginata]
MLLAADEITKHRTTSSCWLVIDGKVYDVTSYLSRHPGGPAILLKQSGQDATAEFRKIHSPDVLQYLPKENYLGEVDPATLESLPISSQLTNGVASPASMEGRAGPPHISLCVSLPDFENAAAAVLSKKALSYVSSSANSGLTLRGNLASWGRVSFRPRILRDVGQVTTRTSILGFPSSFPFYMSPMGQLGRAHEAGEAAVVRALARRGVHGVLSTVSTLPAADIMAIFQNEREQQKQTQTKKQRQKQKQKKRDSSSAILNAREDGKEKDIETEIESFPPAQLHFQLYVPVDRAAAISRIRWARDLGFRSLWITVDTPVIGKRSGDRRLQAAEALELGLEAEAEMAGFGQRAHVAANQFTASLTWADLAWIRSEWGADRAIVIKGVQCAEDARLALEHGVQGILLSNHGGRQAHSAPDALTTLLEIWTHEPRVLEKLEVFLDGGCRDGADVLKALCLGARAVGVGRPFFHALAAYGEKGVERCIDILSDELILGMRLVGMSSLDQAKPDRVNAGRLINKLWRFEKRSRL